MSLRSHLLCASLIMSAHSGISCESNRGKSNEDATDDTIASRIAQDMDISPDERRYLEQKGRDHAKMVSVGTRAIALARLVNARKWLVGEVRIVIDSEIRVLWQNSCARYLLLPGESVPDVIRKQDLSILDALPDDTVMLDCFYAFSRNHNKPRVRYGPNGWSDPSQ